MFRRGTYISYSSSRREPTKRHRAVPPAAPRLVLFRRTLALSDPSRWMIRLISHLCRGFHLAAITLLPFKLHTSRSAAGEARAFSFIVVKVFRVVVCAGSFRTVWRCAPCYPDLTISRFLADFRRCWPHFCDKARHGIPPPRPRLPCLMLSRRVAQDARALPTGALDRQRVSGFG